MNPGGHEHSVYGPDLKGLWPRLPHLSQRGVSAHTAVRRTRRSREGPACGRATLHGVPRGRARLSKTPSGRQGTTLGAAVKLWQLVFQIWSLPDCVREVVFNPTLHTLVSGLGSALLPSPQVSFSPPRCPALAPGTTLGILPRSLLVPQKSLSTKTRRQAEGLAEAVGYTRAEKQDD